MRQRDIDDGRAGGLHPGDPLVPQRGNLGIHAVEAIFLRDADALAAQIAAQSGGKVGDGEVERGRILRIITAHGGEQQRTILDGPRHRPGLIERRGKGDNAPARAAAIGRLDARNADECRGLADRAASIGARCARHQPRRYCRRRAARRAAGDEIAIGTFRLPWRDHLAIGAGLVRRAHGEFIEVELAEHHRAITEQIARHGRFIGWNKAFKDLRRSRRLHALGAEQILDAKRNAGQWPRFAPGQRRIGGGGLGTGDLGGFSDEGVEVPRRCHRRQMRLGQFRGGKIAFCQSGLHAGNRQVGQAHYSITLGTAKNPLAASGALASTAACILPSVMASTRQAR